METNTWIALLVFFVVLIGCTLLLVFLFSPTLGVSCSLKRLGLCSPTQFNELCQANEFHTECTGHCDVVAAENPSSIASYTYCLGIPEYRRFSACHPVLDFHTEACTAREWEGYCASESGAAICQERCDQARQGTIGAPLPDTWSVATFCDHPFCDSHDEKYCNACHRAVDIGATGCQLEPTEVRQQWCLQHLAEEPCRDYCQNFPADTLCKKESII